MHIMRNAVSGMRRRVKKAVWQDGGSLRMPAPGQLRARPVTGILSNTVARLCFAAAEGGLAYNLPEANYRGNSQGIE